MTFCETKINKGLSTYQHVIGPFVNIESTKTSNGDWCNIYVMLIFTCGQATQVNKLFFSSLSSFFSQSPFFFKMTVYYLFMCQMWPAVARCDQLLPVVTSCCKVWPDVARCDQLLPGVTSSCQVWLTVARFYQLGSDVTRWSKLWPGGQNCDQLVTPPSSAIIKQWGFLGHRDQ